MKEIIKGIFKDKNKLFTQNPKNCKGLKIYNEKLIKFKGKELRSWNPYRSKLAAGILNGISVEIKPNMNILYLGAATGTTVSHISDILTEGVIYAVENSPIVTKKLLDVSENRKNIITILNDANHPDKYSFITQKVDIIYQDISQRNQAEIFIKNIKKYLTENGYAIIMVKARSIDVSLKPKDAYKKVVNELKENKLKILQTIDLKPYEKDHMGILVNF